MVQKEKDSAYLRKIILFFLLGTLWLQIDTRDYIPLEEITIPLGFILGLYFASHDHFQIDRKIEYAILLVVAILSYIAPIGFVMII